jgi:hypothetical protein
MNPEQARRCVEQTFRQPFDESRYSYFIRNLVNHLDESKRQTWTLKKAAFKEFVNHFIRLGTYTDANGEHVDLLVIHLSKQTTLARGRVTLRNFVADYLTTGHGQNKSAVIAAFVSPGETNDWRFSFVKLDYTFERTDLGLVAERRLLTPARRSSYLVGANENCHTAQKQFVKLLESDETNPALAELEAAFSVEKVTDEFYKQYKILFEKTRDALVTVLNAAPAIKDHFNERGIACDDFAKKLLGQIVFLYFLQKKAGLVWNAAKNGGPVAEILFGISLQIELTMPTAVVSGGRQIFSMTFLNLSFTKLLPRRAWTTTITTRASIAKSRFLMADFSSRSTATTGLRPISFSLMLFSQTVSQQAKKMKGVRESSTFSTATISRSMNQSPSRRRSLLTRKCSAKFSKISCLKTSGIVAAHTTRRASLSTTCASKRFFTISTQALRISR